jgi:acyl carrier protein
MTAEEIQESMQEWLLERTGATIDPSVRYAELDHLDSLDVLELVTFSEDRFGLTFSADDFASPEFATLDGLSRMISSRT